MTKDSRQAPSVFDEWTLFEKVIDGNYMSHREIATAVRAVLQVKSAEPLKVLDLGCGDAWMASHVLSNSALAAYTGVDLSAAALEKARLRLADLACPIALRQCDLEQALCEQSECRPNLLLASFSLHHLQPAIVGRVMQRVAELLSEDGMLIWIDLERRERESPEAYLQRFFQQGLPRWKTLTESERQTVSDHMTGADFPLTEKEKKHFAQAAKLQWKSAVYCDDYYTAHAFQRNHPAGVFQSSQVGIG